ncbi:MAG: hypothetical protein LAT78_13160, partial [Roseinatronobacter sp.]|nr:hypothetical protein [Roseinatronobacter sp.]
MRRWVVYLGLCLAAALLFAPLPQQDAKAQEFDALLPQANESDVGFITRLLQDSLSGRGREVRITGFRGALSSRATFDQMSIEDDLGVWLVIEGAAMQWNRAALFQRRIEIAEISARRITVLRTPQGDAGESEEIFALPRFELPELPVAVRLDQLAVEEIVLGADVLGEELRAKVEGTATLADGAGEARLQITRSDDLEGRFTLDAAFSNETRILDLDLIAEEQAGGLAVRLLGVPNAPAAALTVQGSGVIENFAADITLATDGTPRVQGRFELQTALPGVAQAVALELAGDLRPLLADEFDPFFGADSQLSTRARRFDDGALSLDDLTIITEMLRLRGRVLVGADGLPDVIDLRGQVAARDGSRVVLPLAGARTSIDSAELRLVFDGAQSEDWDLTLDLLGFDNGDFRVESLFVNGLGRITSDGFGEDIDVVDALIDFSALGLAASDPGLNAALGPAVSGSLALIWRENLPLLLPGFQIEGRDYALNGRARLEEGVIFANALAQFRDVSRLSTLAGRPLSGAVETRVDATIGPERDRFMVAAEIAGQNLTVDQRELDLLLEGRSQITIDARGAGGEISLRKLEATARTLRADLQGQITPEALDLTGEIDFSDLSVLGGAFGGALEAQLALQGPRESETLTLEALARNLTVGQEDANRLLRGETRLTLAGQRDGAALDLDRLRVQNTALEMTARGRYEAGASRLEVQTLLPNLGAIRPGFGGRVQANAQLREEGTERRITLEAEANALRLGNPAADGVLMGTHRLNAALVQGAEGMTLERLSVQGPQLTAQATGTMVEGRPSVTLDARLASLAALVPGIPGAVTVQGTARDTGSAYALDLALGGPAGLAAQLTGSIAPDLRANLRLQGSTDLALINPRLEPRSIQGPASFDLALNGPLALSSLSGQAMAQGATLVLPQQNIRLANITAQAQITAGRAPPPRGGGRGRRGARRRGGGG